MALARLYRVIQDAQGSIVPGVSTTITLSGTQTLAVLYADAGGLVGLPNPLTNDPTFGSLTCFVASGLYDITPSKAGYSFQPQIGVSVQATQTGTFTLTATGLTTTPTGLVTYTRSGRVITLNMTSVVSGTSNSAAFSLSPLPADLFPVGTIDLPVSVIPQTQVASYGWGLMRLQNSATINLYPDATASNNWPTTGGKGVQYFSVSYVALN